MKESKRKEEQFTNPKITSITKYIYINSYMKTYTHFVRNINKLAMI